MRALVQKELRENIRLAMLGLAVFALLLLAPYLTYAEVVRDLGLRNAGGGDFADTGQRRIHDAIGEHGHLHVVLADAAGEAQLLMVSTLDLWRISKKADTRVGFAQVGGGRVETFFCARIRTRGLVIVFEDCVRREVKVGGSVRAEGGDAAEELDGL